MKQNVDLQRMMTEGLLGQRGAMQALSIMEDVRVSKSGKHLFMKSMMGKLDNTAVSLGQAKVTIANKAGRMAQVENQIVKEAVALTSQRVKEEQRRAQMISLAKSMTLADLNTSLTANQAELQAETAKQNEIRETIMLKGSEADMDGITAQEALVANEMKVAALMEEQIQIRQLQFIKNELVNTEQREVGVIGQTTVARIKEINAQRQEFIQTLNLLKATGHLSAAKHKEMMATLNNAAAGKKAVAANTLTMGSLMRLEGQALKSAFSINRFAGAASLASMGLMMFSESEEAMQASMILMTMSMLPAIGSMLSFKTATDAATASSVTFQAVTTAGAALVAVGIAFALARTLFKNESDKMKKVTDDTITGFEDIQVAAGDFAFELDKPGGVTDLMLDFGNTTSDSMNRAEKSVKDFMSAREELFYGFSPSRMNQTLFEQLVNQGVGELYYRTELNIANNFFGLTVDEMVTQVTAEVEERLVQITGS